MIDGSENKTQTLEQLLFRNKFGDLVFKNKDDLRNFSLDFISIKGGYFKN